MIIIKKEEKAQPARNNKTLALNTQKLFEK